LQPVSLCKRAIQNPIVGIDRRDSSRFRDNEVEIVISPVIPNLHGVRG
jgi:hypothetical protein